MSTVDFDEGVFRQRERTVDNIKRIYAVVYSLSFTFILKEMYDYVKNYIIQPSAQITASMKEAFVHGLTLRLAMMVIFISTVAVFSYQADKFLDLRYTLRPVDTSDGMPKATRRGFAIDALSLIFTLVAFIFMAYAFTNDLVNLFGIIPFFASYQLLLGLAIFFLAVVNVPRLWHAAESNAGPTLSETERYATLSANWFWTNGLTAAALAGAYIHARHSGGLCTRSPFDNQIDFAVTFVVIALARNIYDFYSAWPFLYINKRGVLSREIAPPMKLYVARGPYGKLAVLIASGALALLGAIWALAQSLPDINPSTC